MPRLREYKGDHSIAIQRVLTNERVDAIKVYDDSTHLIIAPAYKS